MNFDFIKKILKRFEKNDRIDLEFLRSVEVFHNLNDDEIVKLHDMFIPKNFKKNEILFRENYPHVVLYIIKTGKVLIYLNLPKVKLPIRELESKKHFGEIGIFTNVNRVSSVVALEDTELIAIKNTDMKQFIKNNPGTGVKLLYNLGKSTSNDLIAANSTIKEYETKK